MKNTELDSENEFDVDEPDEVQNNASDDDWTPEASGRRQSTRLRNTPRAKLTEFTSSDEDISDEDEEDEDDSDDDSSRKRKSKQRSTRKRPAKRAKVSSTTNENSDSQPGGDMGESKSLTNSDSEPSSTTVTMNAKHSKEFSSGAFVVLKTDFAGNGDPPLWKIDGKALLQKYIPFEEEGKTYYKNTSVYSGWSVNNKDQYYPATVIFRQQNRKEHIIEFQKDLIKEEELPADQVKVEDEL